MGRSELEEWGSGWRPGRRLRARMGRWQIMPWRPCSRTAWSGAVVMSAYEVGVAWEDASWRERRQNGGEEFAGRPPVVNWTSSVESRLWRRRVDGDCQKKKGRTARKESWRGNKSGSSGRREISGAVSKLEVANRGRGAQWSLAEHSLLRWQDVSRPVCGMMKLIHTILSGWDNLKVLDDLCTNFLVDIEKFQFSLLLVVEIKESKASFES
jgi:hypothetical protein